MIINISLCPVVEQTGDGDGDQLEKIAEELGNGTTVADLSLYIKKAADDHPLCVIKWEAEWPWVKIAGEYRNDDACDSLSMLEEEIAHMLGAK